MRQKRKPKYVQYTRPCSGCHETNEGYSLGCYEFDEKAGCEKGSGCHECGYTGKRRQKYLLSDLESFK